MRKARCLLTVCAEKPSRQFRRGHQGKRLDNDDSSRWEDANFLLIRVGDAPGVQLVQEGRHEDVVGARAGQVGDRDDRAGRARSSGAHGLRSEVPEALGSERPREARAGRGREIADRSSRGGLDHVDVEPRLHHELQLVVAVRDAKHLFARRPLHRLTLGETAGAAGAYRYPPRPRSG